MRVLLRDGRADLDREPCLSGTAGPREGQEPHVGATQERDRLVDLLCPADER